MTKINTEHKYYKIISDGSPEGTKLLDQNGDLVKNVKQVTWSANTGEVPTAQITMMVEVDLNIENATIIKSMTIENTEFDSIKDMSAIKKKIEEDELKE